jgi:hypothetical protein
MNYHHFLCLFFIISVFFLKIGSNSEILLNFLIFLRLFIKNFNIRHLLYNHCFDLIETCRCFCLMRLFYFAQIEVCFYIRFKLLHLMLIKCWIANSHPSVCGTCLLPRIHVPKNTPCILLGFFKMCHKQHILLLEILPIYMSFCVPQHFMACKQANLGIYPVFFRYSHFFQFSCYLYTFFF